MALRDQGVISTELYQQIKGLGRFRNILIHHYLGIDPREVFQNFHKGLKIFPCGENEILCWLDTLEG